jgi:hypothetical protein
LVGKRVGFRLDDLVKVENEQGVKEPNKIVKEIINVVND